MLTHVAFVQVGTAQHTFAHVALTLVDAWILALVLHQNQNSGVNHQAAPMQCSWEHCIKVQSGRALLDGPIQPWSHGLVRILHHAQGSPPRLLLTLHAVNLLLEADLGFAKCSGRIRQLLPKLLVCIGSAAGSRPVEMQTRMDLCQSSTGRRKRGLILERKHLLKAKREGRACTCRNKVCLSPDELCGFARFCSTSLVTSYLALCLSLAALYTTPNPRAHIDWNAPVSHLLSAAQYPSSNPRSHKDWNKLEAEVKELEQKGELADGDPLNNFFKKIFSQDLTCKCTYLSNSAFSVCAGGAQVVGPGIRQDANQHGVFI
eukprot:793779-Pelagomonas_calceolata.AAC.3